MRKVIGLDRKIKREWLDGVLDRLATGSTASEARAFLHEILLSTHPGLAARQKTVGILLRTWLLPKPEHTEIRDDVLALVPSLCPRDRLWLHWGMTLLAYPFFRDTAASVGRLVKLQGHFTLAQLNRRLVESWGDRSTVLRASQRIVRSMVDWDVLAESGRGRFVIADPLTTKSKELQLWLLRAAHGSERSEELDARQLLQLPAIFPFRVTVGLGDLRRSQVFSIHRQGLDQDMIGLRRIAASG